MGPCQVLKIEPGFFRESVLNLDNWIGTRLNHVNDVHKTICLFLKKCILVNKI